MNFHSKTAKAIFCSIATIIAGNVYSDVVRQPLNVGAALEYGQVFNSRNLTTPDLVIPNDKYTLKRTIGWVVQSATIDERLDLVAGLGGMFLYLYPDEGYAYQHSPLSAVALAQASSAYTFGDLSNPTAKLTAGFFPYKYNTDSKNIGEYLFRSTPYPSTTTNSSWDLVNSAAGGSSKTKIWGTTLNAKFLNGKWNNDLLLTVSDFYPLYDFSPAYVTSFQLTSMLQIGGGVNFYHLIQDNPKINQKKINSNAYFNYQGKDYYAFSEYYFLSASNQTGADSLASLATKKLVDSLVSVAQPESIKVALNYYTVSGTLMMARFSVDFKPVFGENVDFKIYGEASVLGVKNYPVFFEKIMNRVPMMLGVNIPTFKILDCLNVEMEYWNNPYINSYFNVSSQSLLGAIPDYKHEAGALNLDPTKNYTSDDFAWSVTAQKSVGKNITLIGKVARDHLTLLNFGQGYGTDLQHDIFPNMKGWYYVFHVQAAI